MSEIAGIRVSQSVAVLVDGNNIERSITNITGEVGSMLNFDTVISRLLSGRGLNRLIYFREGQNISSKLAERLHNMFYGQVQPCHKSADIPLSIKATQLASKVDTIVIMSGDSDYVELVRHLKADGVRVEIAAVKATTAQVLIDESNYFHELTEEDFFTYQSKTQKKPSKKKTSKTSRSAKPEIKKTTTSTKSARPKSTKKTPAKRK
ncbi:NYN domain-containing protein [bacterium]|nr:NYN domain-containing protein [bacterium]